MLVISLSGSLALFTVRLLFLIDVGTNENPSRRSLLSFCFTLAFLSSFLSSFYCPISRYILESACVRRRGHLLALCLRLLFCHEGLRSLSLWLEESGLVGVLPPVVLSRFSDV